LRDRQREEEIFHYMETEFFTFHTSSRATKREKKRREGGMDRMGSGRRKLFIVQKVSVFQFKCFKKKEQEYNEFFYIFTI
jgi:hypothetical protein